jgi:hypothetical protein
MLAPATPAPARRRHSEEDEATVPARKRKVSYPPARTATRRAPSSSDTEPRVRPTVVTIDLAAARGRDDLKVNDRVRIGGSGLYAGEHATIERFAAGVIPAAVVRTDADHTRQVRLVDLEPIRSSGS